MSLLRRFDAHGNVLVAPPIVGAVGAVDAGSQLDSGPAVRARLVVRSSPRVVTSGVPFTVEAHVRDGGAPAFGYQGVSTPATKVRGAATLALSGGSGVIVGDRSRFDLVATGSGGLAFRVDGDARLLPDTMVDLLVVPASPTTLPAASIVVARAPREATARDPFDVEAMVLDRDGARTTALDGQTLLLGQQSLDGERDDLHGPMTATVRNGSATFSGVVIHEPRDLLVKLVVSTSDGQLTDPGSGWFPVIPEALVEVPDRVLVVNEDVGVTDNTGRPVRSPQPIAVDHLIVANDISWTSEAHSTRIQDASGLSHVTESEPVIDLTPGVGDRVITPGDEVAVIDGAPVLVRDIYVIAPQDGVNLDLVTVTEKPPVIYVQVDDENLPVPDLVTVTEAVPVLVKGIVRATESEIPGDVETNVITEQVVMVNTKVLVVNEPSRVNDRVHVDEEVVEEWLTVQDDTCVVTDEVVISNQPPRGNAPDVGRNKASLPSMRSRRFIPALWIDPDDDFWDAILGPSKMAAAKSRAR